MDNEDEEGCYPLDKSRNPTAVFFLAEKVELGRGGRKKINYMINTVYLLGNLADDPEVDVYENDPESCAFTTFFIIGSDATSGAQQVKIEVMSANDVADVVAGFKKGQQVLVIGELQNHFADDGEQLSEKIFIGARQVYPIEKQPKQ